MKKPIIHVIPKFVSGGVEIAAINLLENSTCEDYKLLVIHKSDSELIEVTSELLLQKVVFCNGYIDALLKLKIMSPKIVVSSLWKSHIVTLGARLFFKFKRYHFGHSASARHLVDKFITKVSIKYADDFIADSRNTMEYLGVNSKNIVPMTLSFSKEQKRIRDTDLSFVFFGRLNKVKNIKASIKFINEITNQGYAVNFDIYGRDDGSLAELKKLVHGLGLEKVVIFKGEAKYNQVESIMKEYNFYLQTSISEGMAISVYQAVKSGLLPIITPVGEITNYCDDLINSIFIDSKSIEKSVNRFLEAYNSDFSGFNIGVIENEYNISFPNNFFSIINSGNNK